MVGNNVPIQAICIALLAAGAAYFLLLWWLKPGESATSGGGTNVSTSGSYSPAAGSVGRDFNVHHHHGIGEKRRPEARRDVTISEGCLWVLKRRWGGSFAAQAGSDMAAAGKAWQAVRQAAADGHIHIWGKLSLNGVYVEIAREFWLDHQPEWLSLLHDDATTEPTEPGASQEKFFGLKVNRGEFSREWRPRWTGGDDDEPISWKAI